MNDLSRHIGRRIRSFRKAQGLTLQQMADRIHKSRATVSKYESGEIILDVETLYDIANVLQININQLTDYRPEEETAVIKKTAEPLPGQSPYFQADQLYFYFYDGRYKRLKTGTIHINRTGWDSRECSASLSITSVTPMGRSSEVRYTGKAVYSDMLIRFSFVNQLNELEEDLLYIFNPLEIRDYTEGLLCGISTTDLMPCAFKCLVTLAPHEPTEDFMRHLMFTRRDLQRQQRLNMLLVDNQG